jgi:hypothetical protein
MRKSEEYFLNALEFPFETIVEFCFEKVFRTDFNQPGFVVLDFGSEYSSESLRKKMVELKNELNKKINLHYSKKLDYQWMGRFDQQETTKFHLDNAADQSFLMLGYEPTEIESKLFLADFGLAAKSLSISLEDYFNSYNPMYTAGEKNLIPYTTEVSDFKKEDFKIVLINNSNSFNLHFTPGVMHKAEIINKDSSQSRIINSTMISLKDLKEELVFNSEKENEFICTQHISKK